MINFNKIRNVLYRLASLLGDLNAIQRGTIIQRFVSKIAFRNMSKWINRFLK